MERTEYSETSAFNIQTPGKWPEENIPCQQHGESLKNEEIPQITASIYPDLSFKS
jgi:hypothetical protein